MVGYNGWRYALENKVSPMVLEVLKEKYLIDRWNALDPLLTKPYRDDTGTWVNNVDEILKAYKNKKRIYNPNLFNLFGLPPPFFGQFSGLFFLCFPII
jgi:hypothetical protein